MSTKLRSVTRDGFVWLVAVVAGTAYYLYRQSKVGSLMRPRSTYARRSWLSHPVPWRTMCLPAVS